MHAYLMQKTTSKDEEKGQKLIKTEEKNFVNNKNEVVTALTMIEENR